MPEVPAACADLDLAQVSGVLAKHYGDIPASARELKVSGPDLRHLTWARPEVLEQAEDRCAEIVARVTSELIKALYSDDPRRQMWASDRIMSSWLARDHPLAPARRRSAATDVSVQSKKTVNYTFRGPNPNADKRDEAERLRDPGELVAQTE